MPYLGNYKQDTQIFFTFNTQTLGGTPSDLSAQTVCVAKADGSTTTTGVTVNTSFLTTTGLNAVSIDLSQSTFYAPGLDYSIIMSAGTVNSTSVAGTTLATFSIENRTYPATGNGSKEWTYTVTVDSRPCANALVNVYSDASYTLLVANGTTDSYGQVKFYLNTGRYYLKVYAAGLPVAEDIEDVI